MAQWTLVGPPPMIPSCLVSMWERRSVGTADSPLHSPVVVALHPTGRGLRTMGAE